MIRYPVKVNFRNGCSMKAIIFGTLGISIDKDPLSVKPNYHSELGITTLPGFRFKGKSYNIQLNSRNFSVFRDRVKTAIKPFGESVKFN
jgi:hypothetical protein